MPHSQNFSEPPTNQFISLQRRPRQPSPWASEYPNISQQRKIGETMASVCKAVDNTLLKPERPPASILFQITLGIGQCIQGTPGVCQRLCTRYASDVLRFDSLFRKERVKGWPGVLSWSGGRPARPADPGKRIIRGANLGCKVPKKKQKLSGLITTANMSSD